jgi:O-methyltransferase
MRLCGYFGTRSRNVAVYLYSASMIVLVIKQRLNKYLLQIGLKKSRSRKKPFLDAAWEYVEKVRLPGDYFEFGVYHGESFVESYRSYRSVQKKFLKTVSKKRKSNIDSRTFYAFDSFEGLPQPLPGEQKHFKKGQFHTTKSTFLKSLKRARIDLRCVDITQGWYKNSLNPVLAQRLREKKARVAIAYIDCDIYESTLDALLFLDEFLQPGSLIAFDDYFSLRGDPSAGQIRAIREFLRGNTRWKFIEWGPNSIFAKHFLVTL